MKNIPNILSVTRIGLLPFFVWQMNLGNTVAAGIILLISGFTDTLDGYLARRFNWITDVGKVLDPVADKLTQATISITLLLRLRSYWPFFAILLIKDFIMMVLGGWLIKKKIRIEGSKWFGKLSTLVFYGAMILIVFFPGMQGWLVTLLITASVICALIAAALYIPEFIDYKKLVENES